MAPRRVLETADGAAPSRSAARPSLAATRQAFGRRRRRRRTRWVAARDMKAAAGSNVSAGTALSVVALAAAADWIHIADCRPVDRFPLPSRPSLPPASQAPRHPHEVRKAVVSEALPLECPPLSLPRPSPPSVVRPSAPQSATRPSTPPCVPAPRRLPPPTCARADRPRPPPIPAPLCRHTRERGEESCEREKERK